MNWEAIGAIAELVGSAAVFATLAYLAIQIRQNTKALAGTTLNAVTQNAQYELRWSSDINEAMLKALNSPETMTEGEVFQLSEWSTAAMAARQNEYFQYKHGLLLPENWEACEKIISVMFSSPWFRNWWKSYGSFALTEEFVGVVDELLEESRFDFSKAFEDMKKGDA